MVRAIAVLLPVLLVTNHAAADPNPKRRILVLEYRSGSTALQGITKRIVAAISKQTSLEVRGPDQARIAYGEQLDQTLVRCAGESACVAKIGAKVGASEVILVGISELGDVILTMQRIDVSAGDVAARIADSLAEKAMPTDAQVDSYLQRLLPPRDFLRFGVIDIVANLAGAAVTVGGESRGLTPVQPLRLPAPATYEIKIEKTGYVPYSTKVQLPPDGEIKVEAELAKRGGATSWYQRWYVLAAAGVIVVGAGGTAVYFATRDTSTSDGRLPFGGVVK